MTYRGVYFFIEGKDWNLAAFISNKHFWMLQLEVWEEAHVHSNSLVKNRNKPAVSPINQKELFCFFFCLSLFSCFCSDNTLTYYVGRRMEIKWGLRFRSNWAIWNHHHIVAKQCRTKQLNYAAEQRWCLLEDLKSVGNIFKLSSTETQDIRAHICWWKWTYGHWCIYCTVVSKAKESKKLHSFNILKFTENFMKLLSAVVSPLHTRAIF